MLTGLSHLLHLNLCWEALRLVREEARKTIAFIQTHKREEKSAPIKQTIQKQHTSYSTSGKHPLH